MERAFGYVRVSSDRQMRRRNSPRAQSDVLCRHADFLGYDLGKPMLAELPFRGGDDPDDDEEKTVECREHILIEDSLSAYKRDFRGRPMGGWLWNNLQKGDHLLFVHLDRAFRSITDTLVTWDYFDKKGVYLHFLDVNCDTSTPMGKVILKMMIAMLAAMAEMENVRRVERGALAREQLRKQGKPITKSAPIGMKIIGSGKSKRLRWCEQELSVMKLAHWLYWECGLTVDEIRMWLRRREIPRSPRAGKKDSFWGTPAITIAIKTPFEEIGPGVNINAGMGWLARLIRKADKDFVFWDSDTVQKTEKKRKSQFRNAIRDTA